METQEILKKLDGNLKKLEERDKAQSDVIEKLTENVNKLTENIDLLNTIIIGNQDIPVKGLNKRLQEVEEFINEIKLFISNARAVKWFIGVFLIGGVSMFGAVVYFFLRFRNI